MEKNDDYLKYEIATELGLIDKVRKLGWMGLSPRETGRIGGLVTKRKRQIQTKKDRQT